MEELLLGALLVRQDVDVVHHKDINVPVFLPELLDIAVFERSDEVVDERLARQEQDAGLGVVVEDRAAHRLQQVGLAQADVAVDKEGVVVAAGRLGDPHCGGVCKAVAGPNHVLVERVVGIEDDVRRGQQARALHRMGHELAGWLRCALTRGALDRQFGVDNDVNLGVGADHTLGGPLNVRCIVVEQPVAGEIVLDGQHQVGALTFTQRGLLEPGVKGRVRDELFERRAHQIPNLV